MRTIELSYFPYSLKLLKPFKTSKGEIRERRGFIIKFKNDKGNISRGDICPFPEFGSETYEAAEKYLNNFRHNLKIDLDDLEATLAGNLVDIEEYPAVRCGIEQVLLNLIAEEKNLSLNHLLNRKSRPRIAVNSVIGLLDPAASARTAEAHIHAGFSTIKIKAGRDNFEDDLACIKSISSAAGSSVKLRIDVNGKWEAKEAAKYLIDLEDFNIEYVEQPVRSFDEFTELSKRTRLPLAPDESVRNYRDALKFIESGAVKYLVLKPMMLGGIIPLMRIYDEAKKKGIRVVVTSSFESGTGRGYAVFAASLIEEDVAHGLATQEYFETRMLPESYPVVKGAINLG